ncbi:hypothetical protein [Halanaerobium saccharolyticum]|nr:hypothetical protein [Halanaerobium saccharolyticum]
MVQIDKLAALISAASESRINLIDNNLASEIFSSSNVFWSSKKLIIV